MKTGNQYLLSELNKLAANSIPLHWYIALQPFYTFITKNYKYLNTVPFLPSVIITGHIFCKQFKETLLKLLHLQQCILPLPSFFQNMSHLSAMVCQFYNTDKAPFFLLKLPSPPAEHPPAD